jgi:hypothetical protein
MSLPPFPVDDATLDLLWIALHPHETNAETTSFTYLLELMSQLGGSDTSAVESYIDSNGKERPPDLADDNDVRMMRDPQYSESSVISALIEEIRRLRKG